jgi:hypothetical protein
MRKTATKDKKIRLGAGGSYLVLSLCLLETARYCGQVEAVFCTEPKSDPSTPLNQRRGPWPRRPFPYLGVPYEFAGGRREAPP